MLHESALEPIIRGWRVDECIEEDRTLALGQHNSLVLGNRTARGLRQRRHAEVGQLAPLRAAQRARSAPWSARPRESQASLRGVDVSVLLRNYCSRLIGSL